MTRAAFLSLLEKMQELDPGTLQGQEPLESIHWDSLALMNFIALADESLDVTVSPAKVARCKTVNDLATLMGDKLSG